MMYQQAGDGPDKGWSWVIAFAACFNSLVFAGIFRTSGVFFVAFISEFKVTREEAAWPVVLCISVLNLTGLITGPLGQRFGIRPVTLLGSLVAAIGISSCFFATSLSAITFGFGIVFGIGYGLACNLMPVIVNEYFLKYRATANGIANSGSCFGSVILPPLFEFFLDSYGLSGCFLLTGGIVLQIVISSALMRPPLWLKKSKRIPQIASETDRPNLKNTEICLKDSTIDGYDVVIKGIQNRNAQLKCLKDKGNNIVSSGYGVHLEKLEHKNIHTSSEIKKHKIFHQDVTNQNYEPNFKEINKNGLTTESNKINNESKDINKTDLDRSPTDLEKLAKLQENFSSVQSSIEYKSIDNSIIDNSVPKSDSESFNLEINNRNYLPEDSKKYATTLKHEKIEKQLANVNKSINMHSTDNYQNLLSDTGTTPNDLRERIFSRNCTTSSVFADSTENRNCEIEHTERDTKTEKSVLKSFRKVLTCPMFYVTATTNVSFYFLYHMYVVIIVDFSLDRGVLNKDTKYVLFAFAISDLFGRLCFGWITDRKLLQRSQYVMCCMTLMGVVFFCFPFVIGYTGLMVVSSLYGLLLGCTMVVFPILLVDFLGLEIHAVAYGCMCFMNGLVSLLRPFLIGYFRDNIGSYSNIFYVLGGISLVSSFLWLLENCFVKTEKTNKETSPV